MFCVRRSVLFFFIFSIYLSIYISIYLYIFLIYNNSHAFVFPLSLSLSFFLYRSRLRCVMCLCPCDVLCVCVGRGQCPRRRPARRGIFAQTRKSAKMQPQRYGNCPELGQNRLTAAFLNKCPDRSMEV